MNVAEYPTILVIFAIFRKGVTTSLTVSTAFVDITVIESSLIGG